VERSDDLRDSLTRKTVLDCDTIDKVGEEGWGRVESIRVVLGDFLRRLPEKTASSV
jgi:hypothetical protein